MSYKVDVIEGNHGSVEPEAARMAVERAIMEPFGGLTEEKWTRFAAARDRLGHPVSPLDPRAVRWCATGWLMASGLGIAAYWGLYESLEDAIVTYAPSLQDRPGREDLLTYYNDWVAQGVDDLKRLTEAISM